jgi:hypothetical protein
MLCQHLRLRDEADLSMYLNGNAWRPLEIVQLVYLEHRAQWIPLIFLRLPGPFRASFVYSCFRATEINRACRETFSSPIYSPSSRIALRTEQNFLHLVSYPLTHTKAFTRFRLSKFSLIVLYSALFISAFSCVHHSANFEPDKK